MLLTCNNSAFKVHLDRVLNSDSSDFYIKKYKVINKLTDLEVLPFLNREELVSTSIFDRLYIPQSKVVFFGFSSGTTSGSPLVSVFGEINNYFVEPSWGTNITRPLIVYPPLNKNYGASFIQQCRQAQCPVSPVFGDYEKLANSAVLASMTQCDSIYATPTIAIAIAPYIHEYYDISAIKLLAVASELITPTIWNQLRCAYPNAQITNLYASSEIGQFIMYTTPTQSDRYENKFNVISSALTALELIENELVVTYTLNPALPLIRYRTGDYFSLISSDGDELVLEMIGREGVDRIKVAGFEICSREIDEWVSKQPQKIKDYQLHVYEQSNGTHRLLLECVLEEGCEKIYPAIQSVLEENFRNQFRFSSQANTLSLIAMNVFDNTQIVSFVSQTSVSGSKRRVLIYHKK